LRALGTSGRRCARRTLYMHPAWCGHIHSMCLRYLYGGLMDGMRIACGMCPRPAILPDCKVARGYLGQYCGLPLRYLGNIVGGARNLCTLYIHPECCGHIHSICLWYLYGSLAISGGRQPKCCKIARLPYNSWLNIVCIVHMQYIHALVMCNLYVHDVSLL